jgi:hypothetical protein
MKLFFWENNDIPLSASLHHSPQSNLTEHLIHCPCAAQSRTVGRSWAIGWFPKGPETVTAFDVWQWCCGISYRPETIPVQRCERSDGRRPGGRRSSLLLPAGASRRGFEISRRAGRRRVAASATGDSPGSLCGKIYREIAHRWTYRGRRL